jgi:hypothetical protein
MISEQVLYVLMYENKRIQNQRLSRIIEETTSLYVKSKSLKMTKLYIIYTLIK